MPTNSSLALRHPYYESFKQAQTVKPSPLPITTASDNHKGTVPKGRRVLEVIK